MTRNVYTQTNILYIARYVCMYVATRVSKINRNLQKLGHNFPFVYTDTHINVCNIPTYIHMYT